MPKIDYESFIEDNFYIKNKQGILVPFVLNDVQREYLQTLINDYTAQLQGIRENILKGRQFGISSLIEGIFCTDFILSALGDIPIIDSDVYSHKDEETKAHVTRFNLFLNSYLIQDQGGSIEDMENAEAISQLRKAFLKTDSEGELVSRGREARYTAQTASAKVSGRGGTKQNIHWTEPAFYPNTEIMNAKKLMVGAEKQVPDNYGKIFRESTGRSKGDYFAEEYYRAKDGRGDYTSRFMAWYTFKDYQKPAPKKWEIPDYYRNLIRDGQATIDQCYWHYDKTNELDDKEELREYPTFDYEAFIAGGSPYFSQDALIHYENNTKEPIKEVLYATAL